MKVGTVRSTSIVAAASCCVLLCLTLMHLRSWSTAEVMQSQRPPALLPSPASKPKTSETPDNALALLRNVFLFGDSLTAGAYYAERAGGGLKLTSHNWAPAAEAWLRRQYCKSRSSRHYSSFDECVAQIPIHVSAKGFPGKASKALLDKLGRAQATGKLSHFSLIVIMSGTNDIVGLRGELRDAVRYVESLHRIAADAACRDKPGRCGTVALLPPPFNYSLPSSWYRQKTPRAYCGKSSKAVTRRGSDLKKLLLDSSSVGHCFMSWDGATDLVHDAIHGNSSLWSDCLHPNDHGYEAFGRTVAAHLWEVAEGRQSLCQEK